MDGPSLPLNVRRLLTTNLVVNRLHMFVNGIAILALFHYRVTTLVRVFKTRETPLLPYLIVLVSEIVLTFLWVLHQAYKWRPVKLEVYPERLPGDEKLPPVDVFVCTADPSKEPSLGVMNTVLSAMALDYPPDKLAVYLQDDGGSYVTLNAVREAWKFARFWVPFRRKYELKFPCPEAYFSAEESAHERFIGSSEFAAEKKIIEKRYAEFQEALGKNSVNASDSVSRDHPPVIEVMTDENGDSNLKEMPLLVYVAREKRPGHPHHFKGGALNVLLRVSAVISNAPYFMVLDCDMYCNDPSSVRQTMCFYLDPKVSPQIAWVQFPQKFRNLSKHDIYGGSLHHLYRIRQGLDGLRGPQIYGCNFVMKREAIYGTDKIQKEIDLNQLKKSFGSSNEFIKSIFKNYKPLLPEDRKPSAALQKELQLLASCTYDNGTQWEKEANTMVVWPNANSHHSSDLSTLRHSSVPEEVSDPYFIAFAFVFLSPQLKHVQEVVSFGDSLWTLLYELRVWMMKSGACYFFALMNAFLHKLGLHEANFSLTSKVVDDEQTRRYEQGIYDFQVSPLLLNPLCSLYILNLATLILGIPRIFHAGDQFFAQAFLSFFGVIVNYHLLEGMFLRKDNGRIAPSVTLLSVAISAIILCCGSLLLIY
ncbi:Cellulose synthase-like protein G2 [Sesamum angolense]|uniref:Cellulose synthase-like protein G2 n=1 Tax=Sesamum angolense TaxID=2727404 RepID=A0AAE1X6W7_9LAMI|nr:Cellulose synthase-like protein G2 [Sesamum angolense]